MGQYDICNMVWYSVGMLLVWLVTVETVDFDPNLGPTLQWPPWEAEVTSTRPTRLSLVSKNLLIVKLLHQIVKHQLSSKIVKQSQPDSDW